MADKHVCKYCGEPRSGHDCKVAGRVIDKKNQDDFILVVAAAAMILPHHTDVPDDHAAFDVSEFLAPDSSGGGYEGGEL